MTNTADLTEMTDQAGNRFLVDLSTARFSKIRGGEVAAAHKFIKTTGQFTKTACAGVLLANMTEVAR